MRREYAARNPYNQNPITVPGDTLENALKLVQLIAGTQVITRTVTEWSEWNPPFGDQPTYDDSLIANLEDTISEELQLGGDPKSVAHAVATMLARENLR